MEHDSYIRSRTTIGNALRVKHGVSEMWKRLALNNEKKLQSVHFPPPAPCHPQSFDPWAQRPDGHAWWDEERRQAKALTKRANERDTHEKRQMTLLSNEHQRGNTLMEATQFLNGLVDQPGPSAWKSQYSTILFSWQVINECTTYLPSCPA